MSKCRHKNTTFYRTEENAYPHSTYDSETQELEISFEKELLIDCIEDKVLCDDCGQDLEFTEIAGSI